MALDSSGNVRVDFVWGRMAMQPDDERDGGGQPVTFIEANGDQNKGWSGTLVYPATALDATLGDHTVATTRYNGFPDYIRAYPYEDTVANVTVPNLVGMTLSEASDALDAVDLVGDGLTSTEVGATVSNDGKVKTQTPAAGTAVNVGASVDVVVFAAPTVPNLVGLTEAAATAALLDAFLVKGTVTPTVEGATAENDGLVKTQSVAADTKANTGSAVNLVLFAYAG